MNQGAKDLQSYLQKLKSIYASVTWWCKKTLFIEILERPLLSGHKTPVELPASGPLRRIARTLFGKGVFTHAAA